MKRRNFMQQAALVGGLGTLLGKLKGAEETPEAAKAEEGEALQLMSGPPVVTNPHENGVTILWGLTCPATGWVEYGTTPELGEKMQFSEAGLIEYDAYRLKVVLKDLKAGTRYYYRVHTVALDFKGAYSIKRGEEERSAIYQFSTLSARAKTANIAVWNDTHEQAPILTALAAKTAKEKPDFMVWNGDLTDDIYDQPRMVKQFLTNAGEEVAANWPMCFVRGNHDTRGPGARFLSRYTETPDGKSYYWFRQGPVACLIMDTGEDKPDNHPVYGGLNDFSAFRQEQAEWLEKVIEEPKFKNAPFRVLFCHIPLRWNEKPNSGDWSEDSRKRWHASLVKGKVDLVVSGHTHRHHWLPANKEFPYAQLVGGGRKLDSATYASVVASSTSMQMRLESVQSGQVIYQHEFKA